MRLGLLADIHGNSLALRVVLERASELRVEALCIAGDFVGYYYHPDEVLELLAQWQTFRVRGNHDRMLASVMHTRTQLPELERRYGHGLRIAIDCLDASQKNMLATLPETMMFSIGGRRVLLAHGAPWDADQYVYPDAPETTWNQFEGYEADLIVLGHTHYQVVRRKGDMLIVNPGSVGQPRDGRPGAAWAVYDTTTGHCEPNVEPYDVGTVAAEAQRYDPDLGYLREILRRKCPAFS